LAPLHARKRDPVSCPDCVRCATGDLISTIYREEVRADRKVFAGSGQSTPLAGEQASATVVALAGARHGVYNVVDDEPAIASQWMPVYAEALGAKGPPRVPAFVARLIVGDAIVKLSLGLRGASNAKIKAELGWRPRYASWRQGFFEDAVTRLRSARSG
jgi:nucleoside-diphosphate-sugar epimerase